MGLLRLTLALLIMASHAASSSRYNAIGNTAVFIFYAMSGYACTAAMQGSYKGHPWRFLASRYIRIWPSYLVIFALASLAWMVFDDLHNMAMPTGIRWWQQLTMINVGGGRLVPPAWVLRYILMGYLLITLGISSTSRRSLCWLSVSFVWAQHQALVLDWPNYYGSWAAWSLSCSVGAAAYWMRVEVPRATGMAGEIAFPIFLSHYLILSVIRGAGLPPGWPLFFAALPPTLALSWLLVVAVERPIARYRKKFHTKHMET